MDKDELKLTSSEIGILWGTESIFKGTKYIQSSYSNKFLNCINTSTYNKKLRHSHFYIIKRNKLNSNKNKEAGTKLAKK